MNEALVEIFKISGRKMMIIKVIRLLEKSEYLSTYNPRSDAKFNLFLCLWAFLHVSKAAEVLSSSSSRIFLEK